MPLLDKGTSRKGKNKFKVAGSFTTAVVGGADIRSREEKHRFKVVFKNEVLDGVTPVNIYWIDHGGKETLKKENLAFGEDYSTSTYFSHPWVFRKSPGDGAKLIADGNGIQSALFEGEKFLAIPNEKMLVLISESKT